MPKIDLNHLKKGDRVFVIVKIPGGLQILERRLDSLQDYSTRSPEDGPRILLNDSTYYLRSNCFCLYDEAREVAVQRLKNAINRL